MNSPFDTPFAEEGFELADDFESFALDNEGEEDLFHEHYEDGLLLEDEAELVMADEYDDEDDFVAGGEAFEEIVNLEDFNDFDEAEESESWDDDEVLEAEFFRETEHGPAGTGYEQDERLQNQEVVVGTNKLKSIRMPAAPAPCKPDTPSPAGSRGGGSRVPDYRPGSGRVRRRRSRPYVKWVQRSLNQVLGTALTVDGIWGRRTSRALRQFQKRAQIAVDGKIGPQTEGALRKWTRTEPPEREAFFEGVAPAAAVAPLATGTAKAALGLNFVKFGFEQIGKLAAGDVKFIAPRSSVGIKAKNVPSHYFLQPQPRSVLLTNFIEESKIGIEQVNIKLRCKVLYDGLNLSARFSFDPKGRRSRLGRDTVIRIDSPMALETEKAPVAWQRCGVADYRVLRIPISFRIDRPWPLSNYNENFELVLSTMYGFGATAKGPGRAHIQNQRFGWN